MAAGKRAAQARGVAQEMVSRVQRAWGESPFYQARLKGPAPDRLHFLPVDPRTPDPAVGESLLAGRITVGADTIDCEGELPRIWDLAPEGSPLWTFLQDFSWLRHCEAAGGEAQAPVRAIMSAWLDRYEKWAPEAWEPSITSERLVQLCGHGPLMLRGADALWRSRVLTSMARQTRHLARSGHRAPTDYSRLMTALGLSLASLCLPGCEPQSERGLELLRRELRLQIRPDGGHVSRNPSQQLSIVLRLQNVLKAMEARRLPAPGFLKHTLARTAANLQFFRAGDGRLVVFNGAYEDDGRAVTAALQASEPDAAPAAYARHTGFQRIEAGRALVIADVAPIVPGGRFRGASAFHFSSGRNRIVVNCGNGAHLSGEWTRALRRPAAHSGLSAEPGAGALLSAPGAAVHRRAEDGRGQLLEIERVLGGADRDGPRHARRFFLSARGDNLRGEDRLSALPPELAANWRLRFHLHPSVKASLARDGRSVILALPHREGWRFRTNAPALTLEKSTYCGGGGLPAATEQIVLGPAVLEPEPSGDMVIKWAFRRLEDVRQ